MYVPKFWARRSTPSAIKPPLVLMPPASPPRICSTRIARPYFICSTLIAYYTRANMEKVNNAQGRLLTTHTTTSSVQPSDIRQCTTLGSSRSSSLTNSSRRRGSSSPPDKYAKSLRAHDALKAFQSRLLASLSAWPRDEGQPANSLESIVSRLTVLIRETTAHSIEPQVRVVCP